MELCGAIVEDAATFLYRTPDDRRGASPQDADMKITVKEKQPYAIAMTEGMMVMAGLWAKRKDPKSGDQVLSCTVLTWRPNDIMAELRDRMPVILAGSDWLRWLGEVPASEDELLALLRPCADEVLRIWPVGKAVGNVNNTGAAAGDAGLMRGRHPHAPRGVSTRQNEAAWPTTDEREMKKTVAAKPNTQKPISTHPSRGEVCPSAEVVVVIFCRFGIVYSIIRVKLVFSAYDFPVTAM
jgi:hypothetical protein